MKKLLAVLIALTVAGSVLAADKPVPQKKIVKKHQKFDGTKVADDKPTKPVKKK